jgi:hypothetical protein
MFPIEMIEQGLKAAKTAFDIVRGVNEMVRHPTSESATAINHNLIEVQDLLLATQRALLESGEENLRLGERVKELSRWADFSREFSREEGVYWRKKRPYCPVCWDVDKKPTTMAGPSRDWAAPNLEQRRCPFHNVSYATAERH